MPNPIELICRDFLGVDSVVPVAGPNGFARRIYLDSTATSLMPRAVLAAVTKYLETACANSHTLASFSGRNTTLCIESVRKAVGEFVGSGPDHEVIFTGNGCTAAMNRLAAAVFRVKHPSRNLVVLTEMEHHSNILPWERAAGENALRFVGLNEDGTLRMSHLEQILQEEGAKVRIVTCAGVSNVTGAINPVHEIARQAHAAGAEIAVDAAQMAPHLPIRMDLVGDPGGSIDHLALSGHKLYAPGSPGVLVAKSSLFPCDCVVGDVGGGAVEYVGPEGIRWVKSACHREEAGTPNIPGIIALGAAVHLLSIIGMENIAEHDRKLTVLAMNELGSIPGVELYGPPANRRSGVVPFNVADLHHAVVAAALSDYFGIEVRNECFCAQPHVRRLVFNACVKTGRTGPCQITEGSRGMVRASFGIFTTPEDVTQLAVAVRQISENSELIRSHYEHLGDGNFRHRTFRPNAMFDLRSCVERELYNTVTG